MTRARIGALLLGTMILSACGGEEDDASLPTDANPENPPISSASPFSFGYVTSFAMEAVRQVRDSAAFLNAGEAYSMKVEGHPTYGSERVVSSNPLTAARLDYAHSTGLTGAGQTISIIDDGIRLSHEMFEGKSISVSGPMGDGEHGTRVAGVAAGLDDNGEAIGFAPGADLHVGNLEWGAPLDFNMVAGYVNDAAELGAVVMNNSWSLTDVDVNTQSAQNFVSDQAFRNYANALLNYTKNGVVVFSVTNEHGAEHSNLMDALPTLIPDLEESWISVVNAIPTFDEDRILSADRISAACLESARFCMTANGQIRTADNPTDTSYIIGTGASFAAPQVAGSVALLAEAFPTLAPDQLRDRLLASADNGYFDHEGTVDFGHGVSHGYDSEFGHGFLDLRAALLPIGTLAVTTQSGDRLAVGTPQILGGGASGDAIATSLASIDIVVTDGMAGNFETDARVIGGVATANMSAAGIRSLAGRDIAAARAVSLAASTSGVTAFHADRAGSAGSLADAAGLSETQISGLGDTRISVLGGRGQGGGLTLARSLHLGDAEVSLGVSHASAEGGVLGVTAPGHESAIAGKSTGLTFGVSRPMGRAGRFRIEGEFGKSNGNGAGMISSFEGVRYDRVSAAVDLADVMRAGDTLSLFASRPVAISSGQAMVSLPVASASASGSGVAFKDFGIDLAPSDRQMDIGFEYLASVGRETDILVGAAWSSNAGHVSGANDFNARIGVQVKF